MRKLIVIQIALLSLLTLAGAYVHAQAAGGSISGTVSDPNGAVIPNATINITNKATSAVRSAKTDSAGLYSAPGLDAGDYEVRAEITGFKTLAVQTTVETGRNSTTNLLLTIGETSQTVEVTTAPPEMHYDSFTVEGEVEQKSIENIPTNGRSYLELASLQPGVTVTASNQGIMNAPLKINILGGTGQYTLVMVDGLQISDYLDGSAGGGTAINFSTEVIQEFQLSSANFDLSTPANVQGAVNMVTRSGTNAYHGGAYFFYRDHNMAAYPGLTVNPANPHPYFVRKNPGFLFDGPIKKDQLFFFGNYEYTGQASAITVHSTLPSTAPNNGVFTTPFRYNYTTVRLDWQPGRLKTNYFTRWTQDRNSGAAPSGSSAYPSGFVNLYNWSEQYAFGATTVWTSNLVSELRFGFRDWKNIEAPPSAAACPASTLTTSPCLGGPVMVAAVDPLFQGSGGTSNLAINGLPQMNMAGDSTFAAGVNQQAAQNRLARDYEPQVNISWQHGRHRVKFGYDLDLVNIQWKDGVCLVGCLATESVETTQTNLGTGYQSFFGNGLGDPLPTTVTTNQQLLQLPIEYPSGGFSGGTFVGPEEIPGPYEFNKERKEIRSRWFAEDYWKLKSNLTVNFGLGYVLEARLFPIDMPMPALEGPLFGGTPGQQFPATPESMVKFQPGLGFSYSPGSSGKNVIRGGAGLYWDTINFSTKSHSLANIGPIGNGPLVAPASLFTNLFGAPANGITPIDPTVIYVPSGTTGALPTSSGQCKVTSTNSTYCPLPVGAPLPSTTFSTLTLGQYLQIYNQEFPAINALFTNNGHPITGGPYQYSNVDLIKADTTSFNYKFPLPRSYQVSIGYQRQVSRDIVVTADVVGRFVNQGSNLGLDLNHYTAYSPTSPGVQTPVVPKCTAANDGGSVFTLGAQCSTGAMTKAVAGLQSRYTGLLVSVRKNLAHHYQFNLSYAFQDLESETIVNLNNYKQGWGPMLAHQNLNVSGLVNLPWGFGLSFNSSAISRTPVEITTTGVDLSGTSVTSAGPLPGLPFRGLPSQSALASAVSAFNTKYAGTKSPANTTISPYVLPQNYRIGGKPQITQDFRLTKTFTFERRYSVSLYGEVFNTFNLANLTGYSSGLDKQVSSGPQTFAFGLPTARAGQVFLSQGPRAEQVGMRITF